MVFFRPETSKPLLKNSIRLLECHSTCIKSIKLEKSIWKKVSAKKSTKQQTVHGFIAPRKCSLDFRSKASSNATSFEQIFTDISELNTTMTKKQFLIFTSVLFVMWPLERFSITALFFCRSSFDKCSRLKHQSTSRMRPYFVMTSSSKGLDTTPLVSAQLLKIKHCYSLHSWILHSELYKTDI